MFILVCFFLFFILSVQCAIDLKLNRLVIGTTGTATPFLGEADIPVVDRPLQGVPMDVDRDFAEALAKSAAEAGMVVTNDAPSGTPGYRCTLGYHVVRRHLVSARSKIV